MHIKSWGCYNPNSREEDTGKSLGLAGLPVSCTQQDSGHWEVLSQRECGWHPWWKTSSIALGIHMDVHTRTYALTPSCKLVSKQTNKPENTRRTNHKWSYTFLSTCMHAQMNTWIYFLRHMHPYGHRLIPL